MSLFELTEQLNQYGVQLFLVDNQIKVKRPQEWGLKWQNTPPQAQELLRQLKARKVEIMAYLQEQAINALLLKTCRQIKPYQFTKEPLTWAVEHNRQDMSYALFEAEVNLNGAVMARRLGEATHWADRLAAAWERLYASSRAVS